MLIKHYFDNCNYVKKKNYKGFIFVFVSIVILCCYHNILLFQPNIVASEEVICGLDNVQNETYANMVCH